MVTRFEIGGTIYEQGKGGYFYKSTGKADRQGNPLMVRIGRKAFEEASERVKKAPQGNGTEQGGGKADGGAKEAAQPEIIVPGDMTDAQYANLEKLVAGRATLLSHALGGPVSVSREDGKIAFSGFEATDVEHEVAYARFFTRLTALAREAKRASGKEHPAENEKYAFRCFLLRLGMIGTEYKETRKLLLERLEGSAAFRDNRNWGKVHNS